MPLKMIKEFFRLEAAGGLLLGVSALLALGAKNSSLAPLYDRFLNTSLSIPFLNLHKPLILWVNDGLMAIFFLLIGLEIKREVLAGELKTKEQKSLPSFAAIGGLVLPALFYGIITFSSPVFLKGWAIPAATDIAFALGIMSLLGNRVPESLKIALVAIAILDDLAAILIIALFYTKTLALMPLLLSLLCIIGLYGLNKRGTLSLFPYIALGALLWLLVLKSGIHATLAGVALAFFIPLNRTHKNSPAHRLEHMLHPWVAYAIVPLFAFFNAGVSLKGLSMDHLMHPISWGIVLGLCLGKPLGVMGMTFIGIKLKLCTLPQGTTWGHYLGMACLTGIGFTMSLFIGGLAFKSLDHQSLVRVGVLSGSLISGLLGYGILRLLRPKHF